VVARVTSGENAGHTVFSDDGHKYAFHLWPSGLLTTGQGERHRAGVRDGPCFVHGAHHGASFPTGERHRAGVRDGPCFVHALTTAPLSPQVNVIGPECVMDPVSFMEREVKQLIDTAVA
jgi:adenylosuccinate synthase